MNANQAVLTANRKPLGFQQILTAALAAAKNLTLPTIPAGTDGIGLVVIQVDGGVVRWRDDGQAPTASAGMILGSAAAVVGDFGGELDYTGEIAKLQFISAAGTPILNISYYA